MQRRISVTIDAPADRVFPVVSDLGTYPEWVGLVARVDPAPRAITDAGPAWFVTLRAKVGPLARSKRLRMVRVVAENPTMTRFERREQDERAHATWVLDITVTGDVDTSTIEVDLRYGGSLWTTPLEPILGHQIERAIPRLATVVAAQP